MKIFSVCLFICTLLFNYVFTNDTIYIVGVNSTNQAGYWSIFPPNSPSGLQVLDFGSYTSTTPRSLAFSQNQNVYIVGNASDNNDNTSADYWTISASGIPSSINALTGTSNVFSPAAQGIAFNSSGIGYIVGIDEFDNPVYWTVSPSGIVSSATQLAVGGFATAVGFTPSNVGYIGGLDSGGNCVYWTISPTGAISGPFGLVGGEAGGPASVYAIATAPSGITYIVGNNTGGFACYWTISSSGVASSATILDGGFNSMARGVAFVSGGEGIIVGQTTNNVSCYWLMSPNGVAGLVNALPNASGNGSSAYGVAFSSNETAYIIGVDNMNNAVYWTLPLANPSPEYHLLDGGALGVAFAIAIYFPQTPINPNPNPPTNLSGKYVTNDFGWVYERCAVLNWTLSNSSGVVAYNIYRNGVKIATVSSSTTQYKDHNQKKARGTIYEVRAVDGSGNKSSSATIIIN